MDPHLRDYRVIGQRRDGALVIVTAEMIGNENTFELIGCDQGRTHVRRHDAEAFRLERNAEPPSGPMPPEPDDLGDNQCV
ncbi:MAG TPA: hypothetical protein VFH61_07300 [Thermoleophilia bacterium]|nr:hypothetical protein [Thermoleophilia bacterium]